MMSSKLKKSTKSTRHRATSKEATFSKDCAQTDAPVKPEKLGPFTPVQPAAAFLLVRN
jgi:hypothetical protein